MGADTNTSDLKNNYSTIRMKVNGKEIDTKMQFLGLIMGEHSKSGINTMFNTGTVVGMSSKHFWCRLSAQNNRFISVGGC
ncbi:MAG: hypothetical protein RML35_14065 [Chloroherpetonaceae bacterium]|nr:hypothetical protein [Chloroherpetonaceae bacterium]